jgi:hypothetical protein
VLICAVLAGGAARIVQDQCGPFTDVTPGFCPYVLELYYLGITAGTSATTFSPDDPLTRGQGAVFIAKGLNQSLARSSRRAALGQWWTTTPRWDIGLGVTAVGEFATTPAADGADIWVPAADGSVARVKGSDGRVVETWTGVPNATAALIAMGRVFVIGDLPNSLYTIDPAAPAGAAQAVAADIAENGPQAIAFDGSRIWTANCCLQSIPPGPPGSISIITPGSWTVQNITAGFTSPSGLVFDGTNMWATDSSGLLRLDANGAVIQTVPIGDATGPTFDGANIWAPGSGGMNVVRAATGEIVATLPRQTLKTGGSAVATAFDGRRVMVASDMVVQIWDAQTLAPLGSFDTGFAYPGGVCSDGIHFWVSLSRSDLSSVLARY